MSCLSFEEKFFTIKYMEVNLGIISVIWGIPCLYSNFYLEFIVYLHVRKPNDIQNLIKARNINHKFLTFIGI